MKNSLVLAALILLPFYGGLAAQTTTAPTALPTTAQKPLCLTDPGFTDFDFWLGRWDVEDVVAKQTAGTNIIQKINGGCALLESWSGASGTSGTSLNHYDPIHKKWHQRWVSSGAYTIEIAGGLKEGSMFMEGTISYYATGASFPFRGLWTPNPDGSVRQFFEQYAPKKKAWIRWFDSRYTKQKP
ncbi:MAG: hypothetical protein JKY34_13730 [Kordiimonadaceae bacterium]|nr:hypothetical protein [Kordiimonadaceae bacterium]